MAGTFLFGVQGISDSETEVAVELGVEAALDQALTEAARDVGLSFCTLKGDASDQSIQATTEPSASQTRLVHNHVDDNGVQQKQVTTFQPQEDSARESDSNGITMLPAASRRQPL